MVFFRRQLQLIKMERTPQWLLLVIIVALMGTFGYFGFRVQKDYSGVFQRLPAAIVETIKKAVITEEGEEIILEEPEIHIEAEKYIEKAEKGEGLTHLARRALKKHLQETPRYFEINPEHKIYIEDYIAKKLGGRWLNLGEEVEISESLLKEAIEKSANLSPEQLQNLEQFSQLVPSLGY